MKTKHPPKIAGALLLFAILSVQSSTVFAQGTAFTYQGRLNNGANPATGTYDLTFSLYNADTGGTQTGSTLTDTAVGVTNGLFTTSVDFGSGVFTGTPYWLQISVRTNGAGTFTALTPRQQLTPTPYAIYAETAGLPAVLNDPGTGNFFAGQNTGNSTVTGAFNVGFGNLALHSVTGAYYNEADGTAALYANTTGSDNSANGDYALEDNTNGSYNTANGNTALGLNLNGNYNTANGFLALGNNTIGSHNTADGASALGGASAGTGGGNTGSGASALYSYTSGYNNTAAGYQSLYADTTGFDNVGIGVDAFQANPAGSQNTAVGTYVFQLTTSGSGNIGLGYIAGKFLTSGDNNIYIGNSGNSSESGVIRIGTPGTQTQTYIDGRLYCSVITIQGGSDLAEPFPVSTTDQEVSAGAVVVIDEAHPGQLRLTDRPYDTRVAGVVSGANGINPGIQMHQEGMRGDRVCL